MNEQTYMKRQYTTSEVVSLRNVVQGAKFALEGLVILGNLTSEQKDALQPYINNCTTGLEILGVKK